MQLSFQPTIYGRYILLNKIAMGGMAEVFRAKSFGAEGFEKLVAIKRLYPHLSEDESFVRMFINEAKLAATLNHVNIAPIYDFGRRDSLYYIGMEYVRGCDLADLIARSRELKQHVPLGLAVWLLIEICNGLDYAHRKHDDMGNFLNLIHRDITPQNILLSYEGEVKITDFGIAKVQILGRDETTGGVLKGKFSYMSPEQVRGERMDHRSDIFSLGIVAWELLTSQKMFDGPNDYHILEKVREALFIPPRQINPNIPPELEQILMKALTRYPQDRYPSVGEMRLDLLRFLSGSQLFPSRAHLSAYIRKLFKDKLEHDSLQIIEETKIARELHKQQLLELQAYEPENSLFPSASLSSSSPSPTKNPKVEILYENSLFPAPNSSHSGLPYSLTELAESDEDSSGEYLPPHVPSSPSLDETDGSTLPDISAIEESDWSNQPEKPIVALSSQELGDILSISQDDPTLVPAGKEKNRSLSPPSSRSSLSSPSFGPSPSAPPPQWPANAPLSSFNNSSLPSLPSFSSSASSSNSPSPSPTPSFSPPSPPFHRREEDDDELFSSTFRQRKLSPLLGLATFLLGLFLVIFFAWLFSSPKEEKIPPSPSESSSPRQIQVATLPPLESTKKGHLIIDSSPWAYVYINGRFFSSTPLKQDLPPGTYRIQIRFSSTKKRGPNRHKEFTIVLKAGQTIRRSFFLKR